MYELDRYNFFSIAIIRIENKGSDWNDKPKNVD